MLTAWIVAGAILVLLELFLPGMVLGFLGSSALIVAALIWLGWIDTVIAGLTTWSILSLVLLLSLRGFFLRFVGGGSERQSTDEEEDAYGTIVDVVERISPDHAGRIHYRDATWQAICYDRSIEAGEKAILAYRENLVWVVEAAGPGEGGP